MKIIEIIVAGDGQTRVETRGFTGEECRQASRFIEKALGERITEQMTAEYHAAQSATEQTQARS